MMDKLFFQTVVMRHHEKLFNNQGMNFLLHSGFYLG